MRLGHVPLAKLSRLVPMRAEKYFQTNRIRFQRRSKFEFGGLVVGRVAPQNHQHVNFAGAHVFDERMQRVVAVHWIRVNWFGVDHRLADVAERPVDSVPERVDRGWLMIANNYEA